MYREKKIVLLVLGATLLTGANEAYAFRSMTNKIFAHCSGRTMIPGYKSKGDSCDSCHNNRNQQDQYSSGNLDFFCPAAQPTPEPAPEPVQNQAPMANTGGPYNGTVNMPVTFDGNGSKDADGSIKTYSWDFGDGSSGNGVKTTHSYTQSGTYDLTLKVTDDAGDSATDTTEVTIGEGNQSPVAKTSGPYSAMTNEDVQFDASDSMDADGSITSYGWNFGDGMNGDGVRPTHSYSSKGTYNVTLTVTDNDGAVDSVMTSVTINSSVTPSNKPPLSDPGDPYFVNDGEAVMFDGSGSSDPDGSIVSYAWDFGDTATSTEMNPAHTYAASGSYTVTLKVADNQGLTGTAMTTVTVGSVGSQQPPVARANGPYMGSVGMIVNFNSSGSEDPDGMIESYEWDFGDGEIITGFSDGVSHAYAQSGSYTVTLKVTDNDGLMDMETTTATIGMGNLAPVAEVKGPYVGRANDEIQFYGSQSLDQDGSIVTYAWSFGDGTVESDSNATPTHSYSSIGIYNVTLTVTDNTGAVDADSTTVLVAPRLALWAGSAGGGFLLIMAFVLSLSASGRKVVLERDEEKEV
jgi:PKD repeat protein